jgi:hypothetical protein
MSTPVYFDTWQFEFSHNRKPRGRGSWAFELRQGDEGVKFFQGTYTEAKSQAAAWAKSVAAAANYEGELDLEVLP